MSYFGVSLRNGIGLGLGTVPSLSNTPLAYRLAPTLTLSFAGATALDPRITFTRASSATFTNSSGLVASAATNVPRLDYDPVTLQPKGLLIEEARTNLLTYSEQFDNATGWNLYLTSVSANSIAAPDGTVTADLLTATTNGGFINNKSGGANGVAVTASTVYTSSFYIEQNTSTASRLSIYDGAIAVQIATALISWSGTVPSIGANSGWNSTPTITAVGNGWYRVVGAASSGIYTTMTVLIYSGGLNESVYLWGAQLEAGAFATSYIPTVAAQATRAAENAVMTGTNFSSWYNATEGTLCAEADVIYTGNFLTYPTYFIISDNSNSLLQVYGGLASTAITPNMQVAGVNQLDYVGLNRTSGFDKLAVAYQANNTQFAMNAVTTTTDTVCSIPTVNRLDLGGRNTAYLNGHIKRITYWPRRLSNAELQAVTR